MLGKKYGRRSIQRGLGPYIRVQDPRVVGRAAAEEGWELAYGV